MRPTRLLTGLVSVVLLVVGLIALLPDCASACLCAWKPGIPEQGRAERALDRSSAVFAGEVVDSCGETTPLSKASADLEALGNGETLGGSGVLSDTSGGFLGSG